MRAATTYGLAIAIMTFWGGAGSAEASSTTFCTENTKTLQCPVERRASWLEFEDLWGELLTDIIDVGCRMELNGAVTSFEYLGSPLAATGGFSYGLCDNGCEMKQTSSWVRLEVLKDGSEQATATFEGEFLVTCPLMLHCVYNGANLEGEVFGATWGSRISYWNNTLNAVSGLLCPNTAELDATLESNWPIYVRS